MSSENESESEKVDYWEELGGLIDVDWNILVTELRDVLSSQDEIRILLRAFRLKCSSAKSFEKSSNYWEKCYNKGNKKLKLIKKLIDDGNIDIVINKDKLGVCFVCKEDFTTPFDMYELDCKHYVHDVCFFKLEHQPDDNKCGICGVFPKPKDFC